MIVEFGLQSIPEPLRGINITQVVSVLLSFALVYFYWRMQRFQEIIASIQQQQTKLMEQQSDLMGADHQPIIDFHELGANGDTFKLSLLNRGNGPARNLAVQCVVYKQKEEVEDMEGEVGLMDGYRGEGTILGPIWCDLIRSSASPALDGGEVNGPADGVETDEGVVDFETKIVLKYMFPNHKSELKFSDALHRIDQEWDSELISLDLHLSYVNIVHQRFHTPIGSFVNIPIEDGLTLEEAFRSGQLVSPIGEPVEEEEAASMLLIDPEDMELGST